MATAKNSKAISIDDTTDSFSFLHDADYTITFTDNKVMVKEAGGQNTNIATASFASVTDFDVSLLQNLSLNGVSFVEADVATDNKFDATGTNLDDLLKDLIQDRGVAGTMETLTVNGSKADAFKLVWDHLDDHVFVL